MTQEEAEEWLRARMDTPYARDLFGLEALSVAPGAVTLAIPHQRRFEHQPGWFQGAVTTAIGEFAASYAAGTTASADAMSLTLQQTIHFLGPARGERLVAEGRAIAPGRTISYARADIFVEEGGERRLCATLTLTMRHALPRG